MKIISHNEREKEGKKKKRVKENHKQENRAKQNGDI
jgi:hypothetical protein